MSPEKQRIAIAEACGYLDLYRGSRRGNKAANGSTLWGTKDAPSINYPRDYSVVPDFLNDLNAMREAEDILDDAGVTKYIDNLIKVTKADQHGVDVIYWCVYHASASERAEAFLRTFNKWEDS